jgi:hypothetical protein
VKSTVVIAQESNALPTIVVREVTPVKSIEVSWRLILNAEYSMVVSDAQPVKLTLVIDER